MTTNTIKKLVETETGISLDSKERNRKMFTLELYTLKYVEIEQDCLYNK